jgi:hypothetical protein
VIQDFSPWGVYYLEITCGENARASLDYLLHYRSPHMIGIDADYRMSQVYQAQGWPTFVVVDETGVIRFHGFDPDRELSGLRRCLKEVLKATPKDPQQVMDREIAFPAQVLKARQAKRERSPRLVFDAAGHGNVVYYSNGDGTNALHLRRFSPNGERIGDERLTPPGVESYAADCAIDSQGTLWITWCARSNASYDIYVQARREGQNPLTEQLTTSYDDAMSPKIAAGSGGAVTVTYYRWAKMSGISRDRNIFARTFNTSARVWGEEVEISPPDPKVEDHTDPDVVVDRSGRSWVVWSYDYHPQLFKQPVNAEQPTIFAAQFASNKVTEATLVGATGNLRSAIDLFPSAAIDAAGVLWCAWDCSEPRRTIQLVRGNESGITFKSVHAFGEGICSTPELSSTSKGGLLLAWSERNRAGRWEGKVVLLKDGQPAAKTTLTESGDSDGFAEADVLFPQAQESPDGKYWVVYEKAEPKGTGIVMREITADLK